MKKITIIGAVIVIIIGGLFSWFFLKGPDEQQVSKTDTIETVDTFYAEWLKATKEPNTEPNRKTLAKSPILSKTLRDRLVEALKQSDTIDPVLCQTTTPEKIALRHVYENESEAQILITSRDSKVTEQAFVTLIRYNDGWYINDIQCSLGEFAPDREFSFEKEGFLLKGSIPAPYNSNNWHLVFEEDGVAGHVVPLFFDLESKCTDLDGNTNVCKPDGFTEATKVFVHGQMSELGVSVKKQQFVK